MKLGLGFPYPSLTPENLRYAVQLGVTHVIVHTPKLGDEGVLEYEQLMRMREFVESFGLQIAGIENLPRDHWDDILNGGSRRQEQMARVAETIENLGRVGIPILGYAFSIDNVVGHWRAYDQGVGRGDCAIKSFDIDRVQLPPQEGARRVSVEEMWDRCVWFLERAVPVAETARVKLAAHPDDPPVPMLGGIGRLLTDHDAMQRLIDSVPSPNSGLEFCQGTIAAMGTDGVLDAIRRFGGQEKIFYVHFRNLKGQVPVFDEVFIDEGDVDMFAAMRAYHEVGFDGAMIPDHCPVIEGEKGYRHRGMAFSLGYMRALMQIVEGTAIGQGG